MGQVGEKYVEGQRVVGEAERLFSYGLFVKLSNGVRAYIRRRELSWAGNIDPRDLWQKGDKIEAIILKLARSGQSMELSHRATLPDPWDEFAGKFQSGDVVTGTVKSLVAYGVFAEIQPGVDGLIPLRELATWEVTKPEDMVWIGDNIEALITHLDRRTRKLRLSIRARMRQLEVVAGIMEDFGLFSQVDVPAGNVTESTPMNSETDLPQDDTSYGTEVDPLIRAQVGRLLVVDDYDDIRLPLVAWLRHRGYEVDHAKDAQDAYQKIRKKICGLLFVDLNLPETDGIALLRQIRQRGFKGHAVMMSSAEALAERSCEIEKLGVSEVFVKPLDLDEIECLLTRIGRGETLSPWRMELEPAKITPATSFQQLAYVARTPISLAERFQAILNELVMTTLAEAGLIFRLDPVSRSVAVTVRTGQMTLNEEAIRTLGASPVRDVIEEGEQVLENRMLGHTRERFQKLLNFLPFQSCIGIPIEANGRTHHAVFLFHSRLNAFHRYHGRDAVAASALLSAAIERERMEQRFRSLDKVLLSGRLAGGFSHEVSNKMSGLEIQLRNLQLDCQTFERQPGKSVNFEDIRQATDKLLLTFDDLKETVELFQQLMRTDDDQMMDINTIIQKTVSLLRPVMRKHRVKIETELNPDLPGSGGSAIQLQQVFANIMLNAVQHMALKPGGGKILNVTALYQAEGTDRPLQIRFSDTGPGIHRRQWEKIFDLGFTTRLGGTGQGLYIARSLVESLGGRISVERSAIPMGTTFLVELRATMFS
jgi:signal transduction histidine kinase/predicted RNA-binding protein with RPS1 domain